MFSASIPKKIYFKVKKRNKKPDYNNSWINLPAGNIYQCTTYNKFDFQPWLVDLFSSDDPEDKRKTYIKENKFIEIENKPFKLFLVGYKPVGRIYDYKKYELVVRTAQHYSFSIEHDVFVNAVLNAGIKPAGELPGKYIFARFSKKIKPIQIDSGIHKAILELSKNKKNKKIEIKEMQIGDVYATGAGNAALFLGFVNTQSMIVDTPPGAERYFLRKVHSANDPIENFGVRFRNKKLLSLWMELGSIHEKAKYTETDYIKDNLSQALEKNWCFVFATKQNHRYNNFIKKSKVEIPDNIIMQIRYMASKMGMKRIKNDRDFRANPDKYLINKMFAKPNPPDKIRHFDAITASEYSQTANIVPYGVKSIRSELCAMFNPWETKNNKFKQQK